MDVLNEVMQIPEKGIPLELFSKCKAIIIFPHVVKAALGFGGEYGKGIISVHDVKTGRWSAPAFFTIGGGSLGTQLGIEASDLVLFVMTERGLEGILKSKVTLGGDIGVSAGPVGRTAKADTDILLKAEIYSYSRSKGLFAGIALAGATIVEDKDANQSFYGKEISAREILMDKQVKLSTASEVLVQTLIKYSSKTNKTK